MKTDNTILLFGRGGQVATELEPQLRLLGNVTTLGLEDCDFSKPETVGKAIDLVKPSIIVNGAAYTAVDKAEEESELAFLVNGAAVGVLAERAKASGALLVHYSTDYVFAGDKNIPYRETDPCSPKSVYGESKRQGEILLEKSGASFMLFRTAWVYSTIGKNFLKTMVKLATERENLRVVSDQIGTPTHAATIATATTLAIRQWLKAKPEQRESLQGIFHLTASKTGSWWEFTDVIVKTLRDIGEIPCKNIEAITSEEFPTPAKRPLYSVLDNTKIQETFGISLGDWRPLAEATVRHLLSSRK